MDIVVLAGGKCSTELAEASGTLWRALLPFGDQTILDRVLQAVRPFGEVVCVGGPESLKVRQVPAGESFIGSLKQGLDAVTSDQFLLVTSDIPFLTEQAVRDFLSQCQSDAVLNYPVVRVVPGSDMARTAVKTREGRLTGGNVALVRTDLMRQILPTLEAAYAARKKPLKLASMVGIGTLIRLALGQVLPATLPIASLENSVGKFLGAPVHAVISEHEGLGDDVDTVEHYHAALARLKLG